MLEQSQVDELQNLRRSSIRWIQSHGLGLPEAEDIFQQSIVKAIATPTEAHESEKLAHWFYRILKNTMLDEFRKTKLHAEKSKQYQLEVAEYLDPQTEQTLCQCVKGLLKDLPPLEKSILEKHFFEGASFKSLSKEFDLAEGTIRVRALRAREKLKDGLRECCNVTRYDQTEDCGCKE